MRNDTVAISQGDWEESLPLSRMTVAWWKALNSELTVKMRNAGYMVYGMPERIAADAAQTRARKAAQV